MPKRKRCKVCRELFTPGNTLQPVCNPACAIEYAKRDEGKALVQKARRKQHRADKARIKTKSQWAREAQTAFNAYIRHRDKGLPCISCGRVHQGQWHASHFKSRGAHPELAFEETNCHASCAPCNNHLSGNIAGYRPRLIEKIGLAAVEWLEGPHEPKKYAIEDLMQIKKTYKAKVKALDERSG